MKESRCERAPGTGCTTVDFYLYKLYSLDEAKLFPSDRGIDPEDLEAALCLIFLFVRLVTGIERATRTVSMARYRNRSVILIVFRFGGLFFLNGIR